MGERGQDARALVRAAGETTGVGHGAPDLGGRSDARTTPPLLATIANSIVLRSSRTLPGQE
jgi:hypothetical protein